MIDGLTLEGFQSHADSFLDFDPGVNVIVGSSDSGKTAIIRALYWNICNAPSGDAFINAQVGESARCVVQIGDQFIERFKAKSQNEYVVFEGEDEGETYKAMGKGTVPENVAEIYNMSFVNWQQQMDPPFLISLSGGKISQKLNEVVNLSVMDSCLLNAKRNISDQNKAIEITEAFLEDGATELEQYKNLDEYDEELSEAETLAEEIDGGIEDYDVLSSIIDNIREIQSEIKSFVIIDYEAFEKEYDEYLEEQPLLEEKNLDYEELEDLITNFESLYKKIKSYERLSQEAESQLRENMPEECPLCEQPIL